MNPTIEQLINELPPLDDHEHAWKHQGTVDRPCGTIYVYHCECGAWGTYTYGDEQPVTFRGYIGEGR